MRKEERPVRPLGGNTAHTHRLTQGSSEKGFLQGWGPQVWVGFCPRGHVTNLEIIWVGDGAGIECGGWDAAQLPSVQVPWPESMIGPGVLPKRHRHSCGAWSFETVEPRTCPTGLRKAWRGQEGPQHSSSPRCKSPRGPRGLGSWLRQRGGCSSLNPRPGTPRPAQPSPAPQPRGKSREQPALPDTSWKLRTWFMRAVDTMISSKTGVLPPTMPVLPPCGFTARFRS